MPSRRATISTSSGSRPISSCASRSAVARRSASSAGIVLAARERDLALVRRHRLGPLGQDHVRRRRRPRTAARAPRPRRCPAPGARRGAAAGRSASRARTSASVSRRRSGRGRPTARGRPGRYDGGRGMRCCPPCGRHAPTVSGLRDCPPSHTGGTDRPWTGTSRRCGSRSRDALPERVALDRRATAARTWREFDDRAARLAAGLIAAGLEPDAKVASYLYNCNEYIEGLFATFKMRGVPVNVNYRYLEDELVYLLDNSDAEALFFHGSLGDRVAKVRDRAPLREAVDPGRRRRSPHQDFAVEYEDAASPRTSRCRASSAVGRRPLLPLHRRHDRHAEGRDVAHRRPVRRARRRDVPARRRRRARAPSPRSVAIAEDVVDGRDTAHLPASPLMHGTGAFTSFQSICARRSRSSRSWAGTSTRTSCGRPSQREQRHADGDRRRRVREADVARARRGRGRRARRTTSRRCSSSSARGVMWSAEVKQGSWQRGSFIVLRLARLERRRRLRELDQRAGLRAARPRSSRSAPSTKVFNEDGDEVVPGSGEVGRLAVGGNIPVGYYKDESKSRATFLTINGDALVGARRLRERRGRRHDHAARPRLGGHQLRRREDLPRGSRRSGEACIPRSPTASSSACPTSASAKR